MSTVRVALDVLADRELRMRQLSLDYTGAVMTSFSAGPVDESYQRLHDRWQETRVEITTGVDHVANTLRAIREAFEAADEQLAAALDGGGG